MCLFYFGQNLESKKKVVGILGTCLPTTSYKNDIERYKLSHCVQLADSHRLMCILTFFGYHLTLRSRDLRSPEVKIRPTFGG